METNSGGLELPLPGTNFHGLKPVCTCTLSRADFGKVSCTLTRANFGK